MRNRLRAPFIKALAVATASVVDVAEGIGRGYRTVMAYKRGARRVTPETAHLLAAYLRDRARALDEAADDLAAAAEREEERE
jgi:hypothetical protein